MDQLKVHVCATALCVIRPYPAKTIGKPIANSEVYILDDNKQLVQKPECGSSEAGLRYGTGGEDYELDQE